MPKFLRPLIAAGCLVLPTICAAQAGTPDQRDDQRDETSQPKTGGADIIVTGERLPGSVDTDELPVQVLRPADIEALGASSLADLLQQLSPKTKGNGPRGDQGPAILINGRRTSGLAELAALPTDAILRVEIYPEKVALEQGFAPGQRVVNIVLMKRYSAKTLETKVSGSVGNRFGNQSADLSVFQLNGDARFSLTAQYGRKSPVSARERGNQLPLDLPLSRRGVITGFDGGEIDPALSSLAGRAVRFVEVPENGRTLADFAASTSQAFESVDDERAIIPATDTMGFSGSITRPVGKNTNLTFTFGTSVSTSHDILGLSPRSILVLPERGSLPFSRPVVLTRLFERQPLTATGNRKMANIGVNFSGMLGNWSWSHDAKWVRSISRFEAGRGTDTSALQSLVDDGAEPLSASLNAPALPHDKTRFASQIISFELIAGGPVAELPAGPLRAMVQLGGDQEEGTRFSFLNGEGNRVHLFRRRLAGVFTIVVPITSREKPFLPALGDLSFSARLANRNFSDVGNLPNWAVSISWSPMRRLNVSLTWIGQKEAPTLTQLGAPLQRLPSRIVFDFARGETSLATIVSGGNPALRPERRRDFRLQVFWKPLAEDELQFSLFYANARASNSSVSAPFFSQAFEIALPGRVVRDENGVIRLIDLRDINAAEERSEQFSWSIIYAKPFGRARTAGSWSVTMIHRLRLRDERRLSDGLPVLNFLKGAGFSFLGGLPRHEIEGEIAWSRAGGGLKISGKWRGGSSVFEQDFDSPLTSAQLNFSPVLTVNLRAFINFGRSKGILKSMPFFKGANLTLSISNFLNTAIRVSDPNDATPLSYQPGYMDPLGRSVEVSLRMQF